MWLSGTALALHAQGPGFDPQHHKKKGKKIKKERKLTEQNPASARCVARACNPSYSGGEGMRITISRPARVT